MTNDEEAAPAAGEFSGQEHPVGSIEQAVDAEFAFGAEFFLETPLALAEFPFAVWPRVSGLRLAR